MKRSLLSIFLSFLFLASALCFNVEAAERKPYKRHVFPCLIASGDFDDGDMGVTYSPLSVSKTGNYNYRPGYELNFWKSDGKSGVSMSFNSKEWLTYTVEVVEAGEYEVIISYATPTGASKVNLYIDDALALSTFLDTTGSFTQRGEQTIGIIKAAAGKHILKLEQAGSGMNYDYLNIVSLNDKGGAKQKTEGSYRYTQIPAIIEAEDYDFGADGCYSKTDKNQGKKYRAGDPMDIYFSGDKYFVRYAQDEYTVYTFNVTKSGVYDLSINALSEGKMDFYIDSSLRLISATLKTDGGKIASIWLDKGEHKLKCLANGAIDIDFYRFLNSSSEEYIKLNDLNIKEDAVVADVSESEKIYHELFVSDSGSDDNDGTATAPFKTIAKAKAEVKSKSNDMDGDIVVNIMPGYYYFPETFTFDESDSGKNGYKIVYKGYNMLDAPVFGGGIRITGWEKQENGIWKAKAPEVQDMRNLYINDLPAKRARSKYIYHQDSYYDDPVTAEEKDGIMLDTDCFPKIQKPEYVETVWDLYWTSQRLPVSRIDYENNKVNIVYDSEPWKRMQGKANKSTSANENGAFYIENDLSLLDEKGEFYFDKDTKEIYYLPFDEEDMNTAEIYAACTEYLMKINGISNTNRISNVVFKNIDFKYSDWLGVSEYGLAIGQADSMTTGNEKGMRGSDILPSQIQVNNAKNIEFASCKFKCLGSGAVSMIDSVSDSKITGSVFTDIGGSGIIVGSFEHANVMPEGVDRTVNIEIANNVFRRAAENFNGCCGISVYYVNGVNVHHNDLKDLPYTGITMGWGWEAEDIAETGNNNIDYNKIEDVMLNLQDGGQIYTLGPLRNTSITGNYCINSQDSSGGIYLDQGTGYVTVNNNVVENCRVWFNARPNVNIIKVSADGNFTDTKNSNVSPTVTVSNTTMFNPKNPPDAVKAQMSLAGVLDNYKNLLNGVELPEWRTDFITAVPKSQYTGPNKLYQAEDYMEGGPEVGFHKEDGTNSVITYDGPIYSTVGNTAAGDWLKYQIDVEKSGEYRIDVRYSNAFPDPVSKTRVYIDDRVVAEGECPKTDSWADYNIAQLGKTNIKAGTHIVKIEFVDNAYSFDWWRLFDESLITSDGTDPYFDEGVIKITRKQKLFSDMRGHWAENYVTNLRASGIISGVSESEFAPENPVTLYQSSWLIMRACGIEYNDDDWKETAYNLGLLNSLDEDDSSISKERFVSSACAVYINISDKYTLNYVKDPFNDTNDISEIYLANVINAYGLGLIKGNEKGYFEPHSGLTRAQAAAVIYNLYNLVR